MIIGAKITYSVPRKPDIDHQLSFRVFRGSNPILGGVCVCGAFSLSDGKRCFRDGIRCLDCGPYASSEQSGSNDSVRNCGESLLLLKGDEDLRDE